MSLASDVVMLRSLIKLRELTAARKRAELAAGERSRAAAQAAFDTEDATLRAHRALWMKRFESGRLLDPSMLNLFGVEGDRISERSSDAATHVQSIDAEVVALRSGVREAQSKVNALDAVRTHLDKIQRHETTMQDLRRLEDRVLSERTDDAS